MLRRCDRCSETLELGECKIDPEADNNSKFCANCNALGHPASYRGCPFIIEKQERRNITLANNSIEREKKAKKIVSRLVSDELSYAQASKKFTPMEAIHEPKNGSQLTNNTQSDTDNILNMILNKLTSIEQKVDDSIVEMTKFKTETNKKIDDIILPAIEEIDKRVNAQADLCKKITAFLNTQGFNENSQSPKRKLPKNGRKHNGSFR